MARFSRSLILMVLALSLAGCFNRTSTEPIAIGHLAPFNGPDKTIGEQAEKGISLALEEVNEKGIQGRRVEVRHVDSRNEADLIRDEGLRLITLNKVMALLGGTNAVQAERLGRVAQPYNVAVLTPSGLPGPPGSDNLFSLGVAPYYQGKALARFMAQDLEPKVKRVAVLADNRDEVGDVVASTFVSELKDSDIRVDRKSYKSDAEFLDLADSMQKTPPEAILLVGTPPDLVRKLRAKLQGVKLPLLFSGELGQQAALQADREAGNGVYLATAYAAACGQPRNTDFVAKYKEKFGQDPDMYAALAYDSCQFLFEAMHKAEPLQIPKIRGHLADFPDFTSLTGKLSFNKDHGSRRPAFIVYLEDGGPKLLHRYEP